MEAHMIDFKKWRDQVLKLTNEMDIEVMEADEAELQRAYGEALELVNGGEEGLGDRDYSDLHTARILEVMIRWELRIRAAGEEAPGMPYDPKRSAAESRVERALRRMRSESNPN